jgi:phosphoribosylformylglycinamidine synthase
MRVKRFPLTEDRSTLESRNGERSTDNAAPERGIAMALAGNGRWCYLDPKLGAMHAVAEAARKVACTGATPVAATNCLNFGNPQKPEIMAQLSQAIDGIAEACTALGTPITGGNVSLYNETLGEGIYPTPVIGVVGILDDVTKAVPSGFCEPDALILQWQPYCADWDDPNDRYMFETTFGSSEYARQILRELWGTPPGIFPEYDKRANDVLAQLISDGLVLSVSDVGSGGLATALAKACINGGFGARITELGSPASDVIQLFGESAWNLLLCCRREDLSQVKELIHSANLGGLRSIGLTKSDSSLDVLSIGQSRISITVEDMKRVYEGSLEFALAEEVLA